MATNTRIGTPSNLPTGATYDLLLIDFPDSYPEGQITFTLNDTPRKITGIQKVAQVFMRTLLTDKGSDVLNPSLGTEFTRQTINANRTGVDRDLYVSVISSVKDAETQCVSLLNTEGSDEASQVKTISVIGLDTGDESVILYVKIVTVAGEIAQVATPFPQLDMALSEG